MKSNPSKTVYIAGPMRGYPEFNFPAFDKAKDLGISLGYTVFSPADMDRADDPNEVAKLSPEQRQEMFALRDTKAIFDSTHVAMLPGWEKSRGARAEFFLAVWLSRTILDAQTFEPLEIDVEVKVSQKELAYDRA